MFRASNGCLNTMLACLLDVCPRSFIQSPIVCRSALFDPCYEARWRWTPPVYSYRNHTNVLRCMHGCQSANGLVSELPELVLSVPGAAMCDTSELAEAWAAERFTG